MQGEGLQGEGLQGEGLQGEGLQGRRGASPSCASPHASPTFRAGAASARRALQAGPLPRHRRPRGAPRTPRDESANHTMHPLAPSPPAAPRRSRTRPPSRARQTTRQTRSLSCSTRLRCRRPGTTGTGRRGASPRATRRGHVQDTSMSTSTSCPVRRVARACCPSESRRRRRNQPRLQPRLAEIRRDWPRWSEIGRGYPRLAEIVHSKQKAVLEYDCVWYLPAPSPRTSPWPRSVFSERLLVACT